MSTSTRPASPASSSRRWLVLVLGLASPAPLPGCHREEPAGSSQPGAPVGTIGSSAQAIARGVPKLPEGLGSPVDAGAPAAPERAAVADAGYDGAFFAVTQSSTGVYTTPKQARKEKLGHLRSGARVPVQDKPAGKDGCESGWYELRAGGYVCGESGTTDLRAPGARFGIRQPDLTKPLPYEYARNAKNGTPLYKSLPTPEQMLEYEPYLPEAQKRKAASKGTGAPDVATGAVREAGEPRGGDAGTVSAAERPGRGPESGVAAHLDAGAPPPRWWEHPNPEEILPGIKLPDLREDDGVLAQRMVKGFYIAIDKRFNWNGRAWYKTTAGLLTPADRFWVTAAPEFHGVVLDGKQNALPMGWTYGWQKARPKYSIDEAAQQIKVVGELEGFVAIPLTGKSTKVRGTQYLEAREGFWVRARHLRVTHPGPPPAELKPSERWVDVNLETQTLVAFEGTEPRYATLISSGKKSTDKDKDHSTPTGQWRIREKHVTTTMDGDGTAAGDLPYSIEDVPYVMYFHRAYALHGAFWHRNYGVTMSHGCVNLAPLDAKWVFFFTTPHLPPGWHGVWAAEGHPPGSLVVVHE